MTVPRAGTCAVQLLRTYPRRRPAYPFAPFGERTIARAHMKVFARAERMIYIEAGPTTASWRRPSWTKSQTYGRRPIRLDLATERAGLPGSSG